MVSTSAFVFKIIRPIIFSSVKKVSFPESRKYSTIKEIFYKLRLLHSERFYAYKDQKGSLKAKILDPFNTKSYVKIFLAF